MSTDGATEAASILITGGCGFLGAALAARARAAGHPVTTADVLDGADRALDASDTDAVAALVADLRPEVIVHLAAGLTDAGERDPVATTRLNALGTAAIFTAAEAARTERVVYATSISAVGPTTGAVGDDTRLESGQCLRRDQGVLRASRRGDVHAPQRARVPRPALRLRLWPRAACAGGATCR